MSDELTPAERLAHEDEDEFIPRDLAQGVSENEIVAKLVRLDWEPEAARAYIRQFQHEDQLWRGTPKERQGLIDTYFRQMLMGPAVVALSLLPAFVFCLLPFLFFLFIALGLLGTGFFMFFNGYFKWQRFRRAPDIDSES